MPRITVAFRVHIARSASEATPVMCRPFSDDDLYADPAGGATGACTAGGAECNGKQIGLASSHLALGTVQQWADGDPVCVPLWAGGSIERVIAEVSQHIWHCCSLAPTYHADVEHRQTCRQAHSHTRAHARTHARTRTHLCQNSRAHTQEIFHKIAPCKCPHHNFASFFS